MSVDYSIEWISRTNGENLKLEPLRVSDLNPWIKSGFLFYALINVSIFLKLLFKKFDVISAVDLDTILPCYLVSKLRGKELVFDSHEYFTEVPELIGRQSVKIFWQKIANFTLPKIKHNYTVGHKLSEIFEKQYGQPYETILNIESRTPEIDSLEIDSHNQILGSHQKQMVYLGVLNKGRGIELAIQVVAEIPEITLLIIGSGDLDDELKKLATDLKVHDRVSFLGYVEPAEIYGHLCNSWIALNLLEKQSLSYYYSLANKFFDYMNCEIPSINMDFPEYRNILNKYPFGACVEEYSVLALRRCLKQFFNEDFHGKAKESCKLGQLEYNWESQRIKLLNFYKKNGLQ